jgi:hypothetical protein
VVAGLKRPRAEAETTAMAGTNERRSVVDDGWEPMKPERAPLRPLLIGFAIAMVVVPIVAFSFTYLLLSR